MKYIALIFLIIVSCNSVLSQKIELEGDIAYSIFYNQANSTNINGFQISALTNFYPRNAIFYLISGFVFQNEDKWNFYKMPVKFIFCFGKKVTFQFGGGLAVNYVYLQSQYYDQYDVLSKSDFTFNYIVLLGSSVNITKHLKIIIKPEYEGSFNTLFKSFGGHHGYDYNYYSTLSFNLGVSYLIE